jgi:uncharacterized alkaline shock family protein YloU
MNDVTNPLGNIYISHRAISTIASQSTLESYGIVGLAAKNLIEGIAQLLTKDPTLGIDIQFTEGLLSIDLYVVVEYGINIKSVSASISENVRYQVEKATGIPVTSINIHVRGLRISNPD